MKTSKRLEDHATAAMAAVRRRGAAAIIGAILNFLFALTFVSLEWLIVNEVKFREY